jgi:hypothetical protein
MSKKYGMLGQQNSIFQLTCAELLREDLPMVSAVAYDPDFHEVRYLWGALKQMKGLNTWMNRKQHRRSLLCRTHSSC